MQNTSVGPIWFSVFVGLQWCFVAINPINRWVIAHGDMRNSIELDSAVIGNSAIEPLHVHLAGKDTLPITTLRRQAFTSYVETRAIVRRVYFRLPCRFAYVVTTDFCNLGLQTMFKIAMGRALAIFAKYQKQVTTVDAQICSCDVKALDAGEEYRCAIRLSRDPWLLMAVGIGLLILLKIDIELSNTRYTV